MKEKESRHSYENPYVSKLGHLFFKLKYQLVINYRGNRVCVCVCVLYHAYASDHMSGAPSQLHYEWEKGWNTGQPALMNHVKLHWSYNMQQHRMNVQGTYICIRIPTAAVLVNTKVPQSTCAPPSTPPSKPRSSICMKNPFSTHFWNQAALNNTYTKI